MSQGPGSWSNNSTDPVTTFGHDSQGLRFSGDGFVNLMLVGPNSTGGVSQTLKDVTYCISVASPWIRRQCSDRRFRGRNQPGRDH